MGIPGLQSYISKNCSAVKQRVAIKDMVKEFKERNPNTCNPEIVCSWVVGFDIYSTIYGQLDNACGGQFREFFYRIYSFIKRFNDLGIKLVFFFREEFHKAKLQRWVAKSGPKMNSIKETFNNLQQTGMSGNVSCIVTREYQEIFLVYFKQILVSLSNKHDVSVHSVFNGECNEALVKYAKKKNCMAVLTEDSDFIIYDTVPYLTVRELDMEKMETFMYNRTMLCKEFGLGMKELPMFASLYGNDISHGEMLKKFHEYVLTNYGSGYSRMASRYRKSSKLIPALAGMLIPAINIFIASHRQENLWQRIVSDLSRLYKDKSITTLLHESISTYCVDSPVEMIEVQTTVDSLYETPQSNLELLRHFQSFSNCFIYHVLTGNLSPNEIVLEDVESDPYVPCRVLYRSIRQHLYGIVIKNGIIKLPTDCVTESWIEQNGKFKTDEVPYKLININGRVATLKELWFNEDNAGCSDYKLDVFLRCMLVSLSREALLSISPRYVPLVLVINYLLQQNEMEFELWEVVALIVQAVHPKGKDRSWLQELKFQHYEARAVHLATIFTQGLLTVQDALIVCNFPFNSEDFLFHKCFDGRRFHLCYQEMMKLQQHSSSPVDEARIKGHKMLLNNDEAAAKLFSHLKEVAMDGVDSSSWKQ